MESLIVLLDNFQATDTYSLCYKLESRRFDPR
jgi:hypothetical protein